MNYLACRLDRHHPGCRRNRRPSHLDSVEVVGIFFGTTREREREREYSFGASLVVDLHPRDMLVEAEATPR